MKIFLQNKNLQICKNCKNFSLPELAKLRAVIWYPWSLSYSLPFAKGHPWWTWGWLVWPLKTFKILGLASKLTEWRLRDTKIQLSDVNSWWRHFHVMTRSEILCERPLVGCGYTIPWLIESHHLMICFSWFNDVFVYICVVFLDLRLSVEEISARSQMITANQIAHSPFIENFDWLLLVKLSVKFHTALCVCYVCCIKILFPVASEIRHWPHWRRFLMVLKDSGLNLERAILHSNAKDWLQHFLK